MFDVGCVIAKSHQSEDTMTISMRGGCSVCLSVEGSQLLVGGQVGSGACARRSEELKGILNDSMIEGHFAENESVISYPSL